MRKNARIFILGCYLFSSKLTVLLGLRSRINFSHLGTDHVRGQIFVHVFAPNEGFSLNNLCSQETWLPRDDANKSLPQPVRFLSLERMNFRRTSSLCVTASHNQLILRKSQLRISLELIFERVKSRSTRYLSVKSLIWIRKAYDKYCNRQLIFRLWLITYLFRRDWKTNARQN